MKLACVLYVRRLHWLRSRTYEARFQEGLPADAGRMAVCRRAVASGIGLCCIGVITFCHRNGILFPGRVKWPPVRVDPVALAVAFMT